MNISLLEWLGYAASIIVAVSLLMSSIVKLRWLNLFGSGLFAVYGFSIGALPVGIINTLILIINVYYLFKIYTEKEYFKTLKISNNSEYLASFLEFYKKDIIKYFPRFDFKFNNHDVCFYILRNLAIAGIFMGTKHDEETLFIDIDFVIPEYQDFKLGRYILVENEDFFINQGYKKLCAYSMNKQYEKYLKKMGFEKASDFKNQVMVKYLKAI